MQVAELLNRAQTESVKESREVLDELEALITEDPENATGTFREFCECISVLLGCRRAEVPKSILQFTNELLKRLKHSKEGRNFTHNLIKYLVRGVDSKLKHTRTNSLILLRGCIEHLDTVSPRLWGAVKVKIGEKLFDREVSVRIHAVHIVMRYQEGLLDQNLPFFKLFKDLLRYDPSPEIRKLILSSIVMNRSTLPAIVSRASDTSEGVRMTFVSSRLGGLPWEMLTLEERSALLQALEEERSEEIRTKFLQKFGVIFEEVFEGKFERLVAGFYLENRKNHSLERLLRSLMKQHEYADGFGEEFLERSTPSLLFLMRVSLQHIDQERGRDELVLPDVAVLLKSIIDSSLALSSGDVFTGSVPFTLFSLLEYYDAFQTKERGLLIKCALYILSQDAELLPEVVSGIAGIILRACSGSHDDKMLIKALSVGRVSTQVCLGEALLLQDNFQVKDFPTVFRLIEEKAIGNLGAEDPATKNAALRLTALAAIHGNAPEKYAELLKPEVLLGSDTALLAVADLSIYFKGERGIFEWLYAHLEEEEANHSPSSDRVITKLLLSELPTPEESEFFISQVVKRFYSEETHNEDAQYLHVFFHEYFRKKPWIVFSVHNQIVSEIVHWKVFNDQILYWFGFREDKTYTEGDFLLLALSSALKAAKALVETDVSKKEAREGIQRHMDLLGKVSALPYTLTELSRAKAVELSSGLSKRTAKILPDNEIVKNLLFDLVSGKGAAPE
ncbi:hypothetical protein NEDG_01291 [Nematocida displodere]|uniref:Uncharacterized protein n=1 Tax=Nematocida displodere TaxID=1805483 RepID=A0A177EBM3_9MICR|nr:hypothetical protein NEDG_01291 [Nematocida displodere]